VTITVRTEDTAQIEALLAERIYEYNASTTGQDDGESFAAVCRDSSGDIEAGVSGYTWCGCCYISYIWVAQAARGRGIGRELLRAVEDHARSKLCQVMLVATHSFQAPRFYVRMGFEQVATVPDHPVGHCSFFYLKRLDRLAAS
jgi:ribosomal protein S18 acetylase RimI-like enzyme